jgi:hypothetical protein
MFKLLVLEVVEKGSVWWGDDDAATLVDMTVVREERNGEARGFESLVELDVGEATKEGGDRGKYVETATQVELPIRSWSSCMCCWAFFGGT